MTVSEPDMLNFAENSAVPAGDRIRVHRAALLAAVLLGTSLLDGGTALAQGVETLVAPPVIAMPELSVPGSVEVETVPPTIGAGTEAAPVAQGGAPVLAAPEAAATSSPAPVGPSDAAPADADPATEPAVSAVGADVAPAGSAASQVPATDFDGEDAEAGPGGSAAMPDARLPHDLSPVGMYMAADVVVKGVMIGLAVASLLTWTVFVVKIFEIFAANRRAKRSISTLRRAVSLQEARDASARQGGPVAFMIRDSAEEYERSYAAVAEAGSEGLKERVGSSLSRIEAQAARRMQRGTGLLASIGSVAPFVGLFGTVWGIMNSFIGIAETQTTNLAVVAPGIAEALLATAIGLVAAIPAVIFYNAFARAITGYRHKLIDASAGIERLVSRDLDFRVAPRRSGR